MSKSTAQKLGAFYKELVKEGIPWDLANQIILDTARTEVENNGWTVSNA